MIKYLSDNKIPFAIIKGRFDSEIPPDSKINEDLDIVISLASINSFKNKIDFRNKFRQVNELTFINVNSNKHIDLYCQYLSVGYYYYLKINPNAFSQGSVSENEYLIYLILDPLLKFSSYRKRHRLKIQRYAEKGSLKMITNDLSKIIGRRMAVNLISRLSVGEYRLSPLFIKNCKFRLLFINGNFTRMLRVRLYR
tara:strand:- start:2027 stop:2614 length:588 start_codon:yes stop_codon:yes gene_type:complete